MLQKNKKWRKTEQNKKWVGSQPVKIRTPYSLVHIYSFLNFKRKLRIWQPWARIPAWNQLAGAKEWLPPHYQFYRWDNLRNSVRQHPRGHKIGCCGVIFQTSSNPIKNQKSFYSYAAEYTWSCKAKRDRNYHSLYVALLFNLWNLSFSSISQQYTNKSRQEF